jgi:tRNA A-37 threonylcarbamoyl transferase component Bud32
MSDPRRPRRRFAPHYKKEEREIEPEPAAEKDKVTVSKSEEKEQTGVDDSDIRKFESTGVKETYLEDSQVSAYEFVESDDTAMDHSGALKSKEDNAQETQVLCNDPVLVSGDFEAIAQEHNITFSQNLTDAINRLGKGDVTSTALLDYKKIIPEVESIIEEHPEIMEFSYLLIKLHLITRGQKDVLNIIQKLREHEKVEAEAITNLYDTVIRTFPTFTEARKQRVEYNVEQKNFDRAIADLDLLYKKEKDLKWLELTAGVYEKKLETADDLPSKFRLIKTYFKLNRLDEAIHLLQDMVNIEEYRTRALKILGLCLWQKKLLVKAWHKFKLLPMNDKNCEMIYRLAKEMENAEQLNASLQAFSRISEYDSHYRDIEIRIKKINYRLKLQEEEIMPPLYDLNEPRFVVEEEINRGSMGVIYKARDVVLDEVVALKVLNEMLLSDESAIKRFKREAKAAKKLAHPRIVRIHDFYQSGNKKFISMEFIDGIDLKRLIAQKRAMLEIEVRKYLLQICEALVYAHGVGVVHRDIKPANIMIDKQNDIKITDFGIAKLIHIDEMTKAGTAVIGTPLYMAPEQILGTAIDPRTDIYSLGILLYEMLAGKPPFFRGNVEYHHVHTDPPPLPESVSDKFREIVMKCIQKSADDRYQDVGEILEIFNL